MEFWVQMNSLLKGFQLEHKLEELGMERGTPVYVKAFLSTKPALFLSDLGEEAELEVEGYIIKLRKSYILDKISDMKVIEQKFKSNVSGLSLVEIKSKVS